MAFSGYIKVLSVSIFSKHFNKMIFSKPQNTARYLPTVAASNFKNGWCRSIHKYENLTGKKLKLNDYYYYLAVC